MSRVLIAEDSESMRAQLEILLAELGHAVVSASNGLEAVHAVQSAGPFDLMITDMFMPEMDGIEVIENIKIIQPGIKIVAISGGGVGMSGTAMLDIASGLGAKKTLPKPFQPDEFREIITETLAT